MSVVNSRYAGALIEVSEENSISEQIIENFNEVVEVFDENTDFMVFLMNPQIEAFKKKDALKEVFGNTISIKLLNLLMLLVDKRRIKSVKGIMTEYNKIYNKRNNILTMKIITAAPLDEVQVNKIKQKYMTIYRKSAARISISVDKSLIGGIRIQIGDKVIDNSIKARLQNMKEMILE